MAKVTAGGKRQSLVFNPNLPVFKAHGLVTSHSSRHLADACYTNGHFIPVWQAWRAPRALATSFFFSPSAGLFSLALGRRTWDRFLPDSYSALLLTLNPPGKEKEPLQGDVPTTWASGRVPS